MQKQRYVRLLSYEMCNEKVHSFVFYEPIFFQGRSFFPFRGLDGR